MQIYLPIAEMAISAEVIFALSACVGMISGMFGVGGGFLTTPFLIFIGIPPAIAVGTQTCQIVANSTSGILGHWKKGHVDVKMGLIMLGGSTIGSFLGVSIFKILQYFGQINFAVSLLYVVLLSIIGVLMLMESLRSLLRKNVSMSMEFNKFRIPPFVARLPYKMSFPKSKLYTSALLPAFVGFIGGLLASILGVGAGFFLVPAMIYIIGMPALVVAGSSLFQIVFTTAMASVMHAVANESVDFILAAVLIAGGVIGAQIGVAFAGKIKPVHARILLSSLIIAVSIMLAGRLLIPPEDIFTTVIR
jgi:uncharacterized membrane protein YfcA